MKHKIIFGSIALFALFLASVATIGVVIGVYVLKPIFDRQDEQRAYKQEFLAPFHEVYNALREKYPSVKSLSEDLGAGDHYCMYHIECDIAEDADCFAEFVDILCEINALMEARKDDEWFNEFKGSIVIYADSRRLNASYWNGSKTREFWAFDIISDDYSVLWDAFPEIDDIYLYIYLTDYSDEIQSEIIQKNEGRNIKVEPRLYSEREALASNS